MTESMALLKQKLISLEEKMYTSEIPLPAFLARYERYDSPQEYVPVSDWFEFKEGDEWRCTFRNTLRLKTHITAPRCADGSYLALRLDISGEATVCVNGEMLETVSSSPEMFRKVFRTQVTLPEKFYGQPLEIELEACMHFLYCTYFHGPVAEDENAVIPARFYEAKLIMIDRQTEGLHNDIRAIYEALPYVDESIREKLIENTLTVLSGNADPAHMRTELQKVLKSIPAKSGEVLFVGQAHIDTAWLWTIQESVRKVQRTFLNVLNLMEQYPELRFAFSQPALFSYCEKYYPDLFERIREKVAQGRIELVGNAWVEMDTNIPSGESLIRQLLYGRSYYLSRFGRDSKVFWMPDVFGYSWALPQIMHRSGVKYFFTSKLVNNDTNRFPHSLFMWKGIDGTSVLSYLQRLCYNGDTDAATLHTLDAQFDQKNIVPQRLMTFGYGDGGGGPTVRMMENYRRYRSFPGLLKSRMSTAGEFFDEVSPMQHLLPEWNDEMYYENHRGTYTSQAFVKQNNRQMEQLLRKAEIICTTANAYLDIPYPTQELRDIWQEMLTLQFHDILPGSSVNAVYRECRESYAQLRMRTETLIAPIMEKLSAAAPAGSDVWNFRPWAENGIESMFCGKPAAMKNDIYISTERIENDLLRVSIDENGLICSIYDKENKRQVLSEGSVGNLLTLFVDRPRRESAWNIDLTYQNEYTELTQAKSVTLVTLADGCRAVRVVRRTGCSRIEQDIVLRSGSRRIDFITRVDWHEREKMLKAAFEVDVHTQRAACEIQFGTIDRPTHRNTSYDRAKFEICAHRWVDLSEADYGVSLLNDSKYGHDILNNRLRITLLRSPNFPDPHADEGQHEFTYSLYPHSGDWRNGVVREAYRLNVPLETHPSGGGGLITVPLVKVISEHAALDTLKQAENGRGIIIRMYECHGARGKVQVILGKTPTAVAECNLMEEDEQTVAFNENTFDLFIKPYQIRTFRVEF